jgi:hypothetical protein
MRYHLISKTILMKGEGRDEEDEGDVVGQFVSCYGHLGLGVRLR